MYYEDRSSERVFKSFDIFQHAILWDYFKTVFAFLAPAFLIHLLVFITIPDLLKDEGRMWIFGFSIIGGFVLAGFYLRYAIFPSIVSRIINKEAVLAYESNLVDVEEDIAKAIDTEDQQNIKKLADRTGMSESQARLMYQKQNIKTLHKRINTLALPEAKSADDDGEEY